MALFVPVIIGLPIGYFTWATVFDTVDSKISQLVSKDTTLERKPNSKMAALAGTVVTGAVLSKFTFTPATRHRLFFAKAPANANIRTETLKLGIELLVRSGIVFYGAAAGGASSGRLAAPR